MSADQPRLDHESLAQLGRELQAAHHLSEREPLSERQKELLLEWALKESLEAADGDLRPPGRDGQPAGIVPVAIEPPQAPRPIDTAPRSPDNGEPPVVLLLYAARQGGWHTGFWSAGRWRTQLDGDARLDPTHWLPRMLGPEEMKT